MSTDDAVEVLDRVSPFHALIDADGRIVRVGRAFREITNAALEGRRFSDVFEVRRADVSLDRVAEIVGRLVVVAVKGSTLELRGSIEKITSLGLVFVGAPWVVPRLGGEVPQLPLHLLPPHDASADWMMLMGAVQQQRADLERLVELLAEREERLRAVIDHMQEGLLVLRLDGAVESSNAAATSMFGRTLAEAHVDGLFPQGLGGPLAEVARGRRVVVCEGDRAGTAFPAQVSAWAIEARSTERAVLMVRDLTESRKLDALKRHFIAVVAHELRTPLSAIRAPLGLVATGALGAVPAEIASVLEVADRNAERLGRLFDDLIDMERLTAGHFRFVLEDTDLAAVVAAAVESVAPLARDRRVLIRTSLAPLRMTTDGPRLQQVVMNLLGNAVKFSPDGQSIDVSLIEEAERVRLVVADRGPGIPAEQRTSIFELFHQAPESGPRARGGSGIGLAVARAIVEGLGGSIRVDSRVPDDPRQGSAFEVRLPKAQT